MAYNFILQQKEMDRQLVYFAQYVLRFGHRSVHRREKLQFSCKKQIASSQITGLLAMTGYL